VTMVPNASRRTVVVCVVALAAASCSSIGLPHQGFATRYIVRAISPGVPNPSQATSGFDGTPTRRSAGGDALPATSVAGAERTSDAASLRAKCAAVARERSGDAAAQGFDEDVAAAVFASTYADCIHWGAR
jgi:hypothetical protein